MAANALASQMATTVFSDWKAIRSTGHIADTVLPARVFQFRLSSYLWAYVSDEGAGAAAALVGSLGGVGIPVSGIGSKTIIQDFVFQVVRGAGENGVGGDVVFEARVTCKIFLVALIQDQGFGTVLAFYTWNLVDAQSSAVVSIPGTPPTTLGTAQINTDPASGSGTTNAVIEIVFDIVTPAWNFDLEEGDVIRVPFAAAGPPYVVKSAAVAIRTILGGRVLHTLRDPRIGQSWYLYSSSAGVRMTSATRKGAKSIVGRDDIVTTKRASYGHLHRHGAMITALLSGPRTLLLAPYNDATRGTVWEELMNIETGVNILGSVSTPDGAIIYAYGIAAFTEVDNSKPREECLTQNQPAYIVFKREKNNTWKMATRGPARTKTGDVALPSRDVADMELIDGTLRMTAKNDTSFRTWQSGNEGKNWETL